MPTKDHARYGPAHRKQRKRWLPIVQAGGVQCHAVACLEDDRAIEAGGEWDMGHTPDGLHWTGPEHPRCNRSEGATRGNGARTLNASQDW